MHTLHYITLHYITLHYTTHCRLHYTTLHHTTHYTTLVNKSEFCVPPSMGRGALTSRLCHSIELSVSVCVGERRRQESRLRFRPRLLVLCPARSRSTLPEARKHMTGSSHHISSVNSRTATLRHICRAAVKLIGPTQCVQACCRLQNLWFHLSRNCNTHCNLR